MNTPTNSLTRRRAMAALGAIAVAGASAKALAQAAYPSRPLRIIIGFSAGGPTDNISRLLAIKLGEFLGQPVLIENRPGANAVLAADAVSRAAADGYTLLYNTSSFALSAALSAKLPYNPTRDFAGIALTASAPTVLIVNKDFKARTVKEFIEQLGANPGKYSYGSAGTGTITHVIPVQLLQTAGLNAVHIPYKGSAPALIDLLGGQIQFAVDAMSSALPYIRDGRVRALAVTSKERVPSLPDVPTVSESWIKGYEASAWQGLMVPAAVPAPIVARLNLEILKVLALPDVRAQMAKQGTDPLGSTPEAYNAYMRAEIERWTKVAKAGSITVE
jgi:tripartite-type tricarboxylate transporter receptor subunit TctC